MYRCINSCFAYCSDPSNIQPRTFEEHTIDAGGREHTYTVPETYCRYTPSDCPHIVTQSQLDAYRVSRLFLHLNKARQVVPCE